MAKVTVAVKATCNLLLATVAGMRVRVAADCLTVSLSVCLPVCLPQQMPGRRQCLGLAVCSREFLILQPGHFWLTARCTRTGTGNGTGTGTRTYSATALTAALRLSYADSSRAAIEVKIGGLDVTASTGI